MGTKRAYLWAGGATLVPGSGASFGHLAVAGRLPGTSWCHSGCCSCLRVYCDMIVVGCQALFRKDLALQNKIGIGRKKRHSKCER